MPMVGVSRGLRIFLDYHPLLESQERFRLKIPYLEGSRGS